MHVGAEEEGEGVNDYDRTDTFLADDEEEGGEGEDEDDAGAVKHRKCAAGPCMDQLTLVPNRVATRWQAVTAMRL